MDWGDDQALLRSVDVSANRNQEVKEVEEDMLLFQNQFLTCIVIFTEEWERDARNGGGLALSVGCAKTPMVLLNNSGWSPPLGAGYF